MTALAWTALPTRPPVPPCPGHERHHFAGAVRCRRPDCGLPRREWADYDYRGDTGVKGWLYRWLKGHVSDAEVVHYLRGRMTKLEARALVASWGKVSHGGDLSELVIELWQWDGVLLLSQDRLRMVASNQSAVSDGKASVWVLPTRRREGFFSDVRALAAGMELGLPRADVDPWRDGSGTELLAEWSHDDGAKLATEHELGPDACRYLGIAHPVRWLGTAAAAAQLGRGQSQVAYWARHAQAASRRDGLDYAIDPLWVAWRRAFPPQSTRPHASYDRVLAHLSDGGSIWWPAGSRLAFMPTAPGSDASEFARHVRISTLEEMERAGLVRLERSSLTETTETYVHLPLKEGTHA